MDERTGLSTTDQTAARSLTGRVLGAWGDLRGSMRGLMELRPSESTLFAMFLASGLFACLGQLAQIWLAPETAEMEEGALVSRAAGVMAAALIFRTLALYLVAALAHLGCRAMGGRATAYETRAATAWAALVAAPVDFGLALLEAIVAAATGTTLFLEGAAYALALAFCLADRHGFANAWAVLAALVAIPLAVVMGLALAFGSLGPLRIAA